MVITQLRYMAKRQKDKRVLYFNIVADVVLRRLTIDKIFMLLK